MTRFEATSSSFKLKNRTRGNTECIASEQNQSFFGMKPALSRFYRKDSSKRSHPMHVVIYQNTALYKNISSNISLDNNRSDTLGEYNKTSKTNPAFM